MQSRPKRKAAGHRYVVAKDDDASNASSQPPKLPKITPRLVFTRVDDASGDVVWECAPSQSKGPLAISRPTSSKICGHIETDSDDSWEVTTPLARNGMRHPHYVESAMTRPAPALSPTLVLRTSWHIRLTKVSIALTVLSAAAMLGQDLVQVFAIITLFLGFLFTMGSI